jgi:hypothetical protein
VFAAAPLADDFGGELHADKAAAHHDDRGCCRQLRVCVLVLPPPLLDGRGRLHGRLDGCRVGGAGAQLLNIEWSVIKPRFKTVALEYIVCPNSCPYLSGQCARDFCSLNALKFRTINVENTACSRMPPLLTKNWNQPF